jgi:AcrR family transcriptional regulator
MVEQMKRRGPGRPATLSADIILEAALALVEATGNLRLAELGNRLGVDTTAVYRHFRNRADLVSAMADRFVQPLLERLPADENWRADIVAELARLESLYRSHPNVASVIMSESDVSGSVLRVLRDGIRILRRSGAAEEDVFRASHALEVAVFGSIAYDTVGGADAEAVRRRYHERLGEFDTTRLFPDSATLSAESSSTMWILVDGVLDWLETRALHGGRKN